MYIYLDLLTRNQVFIYIMSLTLPDILILLDKKKKKKKSFPQFFLLLLLLWIDIFGAFKKAWQNECKNLPVLCACMSVTIFFFFPAALIQSKNNNTSRNQEIDSRNTVIPYTERMNHTQKETSDRCAFIKV